MTSVSTVGGTSCSFARLIYTSQECPPSQPPRLIAARIRLMTSRCRTPSRSLCSWTPREKRRKQCLWNFLNIFTKTCFIITPNSSFDSAWIAVQESETLVTVRNQLSRIFDIEHGGTLSPHAQTFKVFRMHNRTVKSSCWIHAILSYFLLCRNMKHLLGPFKFCASSDKLSDRSRLVTIGRICVRSTVVLRYGLIILTKPYTNLTDITDKLRHRFYRYDVYLLIFYTVITYFRKHRQATAKPTGKHVLS